MRQSIKLMFAIASGTATSLSAASPLEEVIVEATLLPSDVDHISFSRIDNALIEQRGAAHLEDVLTLAGNINATAGASRQRFFQVRGIGERSQFIEPVNPSVVILLMASISAASVQRSPVSTSVRSTS